MLVLCIYGRVEGPWHNTSCCCNPQKTLCNEVVQEERSSLPLHCCTGGPELWLVKATQHALQHPSQAIPTHDSGGRWKACHEMDAQKEALGNTCMQILVLPMKRCTLSGLRASLPLNNLCAVVHQYRVHVKSAATTCWLEFTTIKVCASKSATILAQAV